MSTPEISAQHIAQSIMPPKNPVTIPASQTAMSIQKNYNNHAHISRSPSNENFIRNLIKKEKLKEIDASTRQALLDKTNSRDSPRLLSNILMINDEDLKNLEVGSDTYLKPISTSRDLEKENFVSYFSPRVWVFDRYYRDRQSKVHMNHVIQLQASVANSGNDVQFVILKNIVSETMFDFLERHPGLGKNQHRMTRNQFEDFMKNTINGKSLPNVMSAFQKIPVSATIVGFSVALKLDASEN